jgi:outer membrane protein assembly factor BamD
MFIFGCSSASSGKKSVQELYNEAYLLYEEESYYRARQGFEEVIQRDPLDKYAVLSELHLAEILYNKEDFDESIIHYDEYLRLNPKADDYEYILYKIGMCHFNMISTYDRDQTETVKALAKYSEYLGKFPNGKYRDDVIKNANNALEIKLKSEYDIGSFYYKMKKYDSAVARFENIINKYHNGDLLEESYLILAKSLDKLYSNDRLNTVCNDYLVKFPKGKHVSEIYALIDEKIKNN